MSIFSKLFTSSASSAYKMRYDKTLDEWQVYSDGGILYLGSQKNCKRYIRNVTMTENSTSSSTLTQLH